jgi:hypothetical protein
VPKESEKRWSRAQYRDGDPGQIRSKTNITFWTTGALFDPAETFLLPRAAGELGSTGRRFQPLELVSHATARRCWWFIQIMLSHGHHQYRFLVDGKPVLDPRAMGKGRNQSNEEVSIIAAG